MRIIHTTAALALLAGALFGASAQERSSAAGLIEGFQNPPREAMPYVWWHWMDVNVTKDGIVKDLTWMHESGIAGFHQFDAGGVNMPRAVKVKPDYLSREWASLLQYALHVADSLGMDVTVASAPGWSSTGGPWVKPQDAMQKLEWKTVDLVSKGKTLSVRLPELDHVVGPYQDVYQPNDRIEVKPYGEELAVLAVKLSSDELPMEEICSSVITTDSLITCALNEPQTIKAITLRTGYRSSRPRRGEPNCKNFLEYSRDGVNWKQVCPVRPSQSEYQTINIPATKAGWFRVRGEQLKSLELHTVAKIENAPEKAGFQSTYDTWKYDTPSSSSPAKKGSVVDLTDMVSADGTLLCSLPKGRWRIYRFGTSITGKVNHPASPEATGLEVDKLDPVKWTNYLHTYLDLYKESAGGKLGSEGIRRLLIDSYEAGSQTWTPRMEEQFKARRGYDLRPWLPVLTGEIVGSSELSERFLWDWRMTIGELYAENYSRATAIAREYGMLGTYIESHEGGRAFIGDGMDAKKDAEIPMSAIWVHDSPVGSTIPQAIADIRESASVGHIYGKKIIAAESFTAEGSHNKAYTYVPENLKYTADIGLSAGLTRFVIHESAAQPNDSYLPGLGLYRYGQWFHRNETWAGYAGLWTAYLGRSCYLLQQGKSVADILVFYGEDTNVTAQFGGEYTDFLPQVPTGFEYDFASPNVLYSAIQPANGKAVSLTGNSYSIICLAPGCRRMSVRMLSRLKEFADAGVVICGDAPKVCASLADDPSEFSRLVKDIWGRKRVNVVSSIDRGVKVAGLEPDMEYTLKAGAKPLCEGPEPGVAEPVRPFITDDCEMYRDVRYVHRAIDGGKDIYWVRNFTGSPADVKFSFRAARKFAAVLNPEDGSSYALPCETVGNRTSLSLSMSPTDAMFIILSDSSEGMPQNGRESRTSTPLKKIEGTWEVVFAQKGGKTAHEDFQTLHSWTESANPVVKYFSGTAIYNIKFEMSTGEIESSPMITLDLGQVKNIAEVVVNDHDAGVLWKAPFVTGDIKPYLVQGTNELKIRVTNVWVNRMIGDRQPGEKNRVTKVTRFYGAGAPLLPSGLLTDVTINSVK